MLNNKLSGISPDVLREIPYEQKTQMFDDNCKGCPYQRYYIMLRDNYKVRALTYEKARELTVSSESKENISSGIVRACAFSDEKEFSLTEIIMNTCWFWMKEPAEDGEMMIEFDNDNWLLNLQINKDYFGIE